MARINDESRLVEDPLIEQLKTMGWNHLKGNKFVPYKTERQSFFDVLIENRVKQSLKSINITEDGKQWLDDERINQALNQLKRIKGKNLTQTNEEALQLLLGGAIVDGDPEIHGGKSTKIKFINFKNWKENDFLAINQFRVDVPGKTWIIPDIVLFVNGIPLVVIECKSPNSSDENTSPLDEGIFQLFRYMNKTEPQEGNEELFYYNQFLIATCLDEAKMGSITATEEWFSEWNDTYPLQKTEIERELGLDSLSSQHILASGMLRPKNFLDIVRNFIIFSHTPTATIKIVSQYHQFRAVNKAFASLKENQTRRQHGEFDQRGGIIWHTPGSGKSFEMTFLIKKMRTDPQLKKFKILTIVDDKKLETQLKSTLELSNDVLQVTKSSKDMQEKLKTDSSTVVLGLIQKYLGQTEDEDADEFDSKATFPVLNESEDILVLVDEAHRRHTNIYHANLMEALPNCAKIGFTGTPIVTKSAKKRTHEIFGKYIDIYKITEAEADGVTTEVWYEGRFTHAGIRGEPTIDQIFSTLNPNYSQKDLEFIKKKYVTKNAVLAAPEIIQVKADDMLRHYITNILPNGHKAQVVTVSRLAAVRYVKAFQKALVNVLEKLQNFQSNKFIGEQFDLLDNETKFLITAKEHEDILKRLDFTAIISGRHNDPDKQFEPDIDNYTDPDKQDERIERFKKPLISDDPQKQDGLAFIVVKSMLLTGFDAPNEQILYLDRSMRNHELLQTISRVNRKKIGKSVGYVVDYAGVDPKEALDAYDDVDVEGSVKRIEQEMPLLQKSHSEVLKIFEENNLKIEDSTKCVEFLYDKKIRALFHNKLKKFHEMMDAIMPHPEALPYVNDLKQLGNISVRASRLYRDKVLNLRSAGYKIRKIIDQHITASGVELKVPPISITNPDFESMVTTIKSNRSKALEMEHAAKSHISKHYPEDPVFYQKMSERLEQILQSIKDEWDLIEALRKHVKEIREGRKKDPSGLDPKTEAPFLDLIIEGGNEKMTGVDKLKILSRHTLEIIEIIKKDLKLKDFWLTTQLQSELESKIVVYLDNNELVPFEKVSSKAKQIVELSETLHQKLVSS